MTLLCDKEIKQLIKEHHMVFPALESKVYYGALSYGLGTCGYDVRLGDHLVKFYGGDLVDPCQNILPEHGKSINIVDCGHLLQPGGFVLAHTMEAVTLPNYIEGAVKDKSTLARLGIAVQNTVLEPGWGGEITLEITNHGPHTIVLRAGMPIAQVQFRRIEMPDVAYDGRYQNQEGVVLAKRRVA